MWQIAQGIRGIGDAARALQVPVVSGNVSLYNETMGEPILPTPTIAMVGKIDNYKKSVGTSFDSEGDQILLIGSDAGVSLGGSEYLAEQFGVEKGALPEFDYSAEEKVANCIYDLVEKALLKSCHDVGTGGVAIALVESCFGFSGATVGADFEFGSLEERKDLLLFGEGGPRYLISCSADNLPGVKEALQSKEVSVLGEGAVTSDDTVRIKDCAEISSRAAFEQSHGTMRKLFS